MTTGEQGYLDMLSYIRSYGIDKSDRTGVGTREVFSYLLRFDLSDGSIPIFTTKKVAWKTAFKEMLWMLSGSRNIKPLLEQNVHIWSEWPHQRYVKQTGDAIDIPMFEKRILEDDTFASVWGDTGGAYGVMWRHWPTYTPVHGSPGLYEQGPDVDQIQEVIDTIRTNPDSRRIIFTAWNPPRLSGMMLPPCHMTYQFLVQNDTLHLHCTIRSWDTFIGASFNVANAGMLLKLMALHTGYNPGQLTLHATSAHIYQNHLNQVNIQLERIPTEAPQLNIIKKETLFDQTIDDFIVTGYTHQGAIPAPIAV